MPLGFRGGLLQMAAVGVWDLKSRQTRLGNNRRPASEVHQFNNSNLRPTSYSPVASVRGLLVGSAEFCRSSNAHSKLSSVMKESAWLRTSLGHLFSPTSDIMGRRHEFQTVTSTHNPTRDSPLRSGHLLVQNCGRLQILTFSNPQES